MYVCGPTVYTDIYRQCQTDDFVTVRRYLSTEVIAKLCFKPDVDDKQITNEGYKEGVDAAVISQRYIDECKKDMRL